MTSHPLTIHQFIKEGIIIDFMVNLIRSMVDFIHPMVPIEFIKAMLLVILHPLLLIHPGLLIHSIVLHPLLLLNSVLLIHPVVLTILNLMVVINLQPMMLILRLWAHVSRMIVG